jgi:hypothetical protein
MSANKTNKSTNICHLIAANTVPIPSQRILAIGKPNNKEHQPTRIIGPALTFYANIMKNNSKEKKKKSAIM